MGGCWLQLLALCSPSQLHPGWAHTHIQRPKQRGGSSCPWPAPHRAWTGQCRGRRAAGGALSRDEPAVSWQGPLSTALLLPKARRVPSPAAHPLRLLPAVGSGW